MSLLLTLILLLLLQKGTLESNLSKYISGQKYVLIPSPSEDQLATLIQELSKTSTLKLLYELLCVINTDFSPTQFFLFAIK